MTHDWTNIKRFHAAVNKEQTYHIGTPVDHKVIDTYLPAFFEAIAQDEPDISILDMGCGSGYAISKMKDMGYDKVCGITLHEDSVSEATIFGLDVSLMDYNFMTFENAAFDVIWARQSLHYSAFPFYTIVEMNRVLSVGGWAYVEVPEPSRDAYYATAHIDTYKKLFQRAGFEIIQQDSYELSTGDMSEKHHFIIVNKVISLDLPELNKE